MTPMELRAIRFVEKNYPVPMRKRHWETLAAAFEQVRAEGRAEGLEEAAKIVESGHGTSWDGLSNDYPRRIRERIAATQDSVEGSPKG